MKSQFSVEPLHGEARKDVGYVGKLFGSELGGVIIQMDKDTKKYININEIEYIAKLTRVLHNRIIWDNTVINLI